jgi:TATA-box binding protein (TBP) (component of TFIID and TFIIIB)
MVNFFTSMSRENDKFPQLKQLVDLGFSRACALFYERGRVVINATTSLEETERMLQFILHELQLIGPHIAVEEWLTVNAVYTSRLPFCIKLQTLQESRGIESTYRPGDFPGLIYRAENASKTRLLVFNSGRVVFAGVKNGETDTNETLRRYYVMMWNHAITQEDAERTRREASAIKQAERRRKAEEAKLLKPKPAPRKAVQKRETASSKRANRAAAAAAAALTANGDGSVATPTVQPASRGKGSNAKRVLMELMHATPAPRANANTGTRFTGAKK